MYICNGKLYKFLLFMPRKTALCLIILFLCPCLWSQAYGASPINAENERLLAQLDSIIANHDAVIKEKEIRIAGLRNSLNKANSDSRRMGIMRQLYDEYFVYDSDSALYYATESAALAARDGVADYNLATEWKLNEAFVLIAQGLYDQAMALLHGVNPGRLNPQIKSEFYSVMGFCYSMRALYMKSNKMQWNLDMAKANEYRDSLTALQLPMSCEWLWVPVAMALDGDNPYLNPEDIRRLKEKVDKTNIPSRGNAIDAYWLARYYAREGSDAPFVKYMTKAAIYDALIVNREIAAIQDLSAYLFDKGQLNRAYNYLVYNVNQANCYHNRIRIVSLNEVLPKVRDAYRAELEKRDAKLSQYVRTLAILTLLLLGFIVFIILEFRKLRRMRNLLHATNEELAASVASRDSAISRMETANEELTRANEQKLDILAYTFKLNASYINALESYRKQLLRKYKAKRYDELGVLINDPELIKEQYQDFFESFDKIVLSIFPTLVEDYNASMPEDAQVSPAVVAKTKSINTKLRIYALRRLGVHKSADIAQMLNISIRTVYNNRTPNQEEQTE